ncbi:MAG: carboxylating nicotinate-nucleotide diphosphorylase [Bacteroidales bacterium]
MHYIHNLDRIIANALAEDIGSGDITTNSVVPPDTHIEGRFMAKETGVVCGLHIAERVFAALDPAICFEPVCKDGDTIEDGAIIATIKGPARGVLTGERLALNFLQRLSGIATKTASLAYEIKDTHATIVDTRKTTPGLRLLEKYAVTTGGGSNHRMNLADGILIKDNHIRAAGSITQAVAAARKNAPKTLKTEVETETIEQVEEALKAGADIIMLDNMDTNTMKEAVDMIQGRALTEASGNMDHKDLRTVAGTGVDMISLGALTHSVKALDISLKCPEMKRS